MIDFECRANQYRFGSSTLSACRVGGTAEEVGFTEVAVVVVVFFSMERTVDLLAIS